MNTRFMRSTLPLLLILIVSLAWVPSAAAVIDTSVCEGSIPGAEINRDCMNLMLDFPEPVVLPIPQDRATLSSYSFWRVIHTSPDVFDAPGGTVVRQIPSGFNFVRVINTSVDGWVQIATGEWMLEDDVEYRRASTFSGVRILNGLEDRFAWALGTLYTSAYPGGPQDVDNGRLLFRYDMVNIFAEALDEDEWRWYMVGPDQWINQRMVSKVFRIEPPEGVTGRWVAVDLYEQTLVAYEDETPVFATVIATGLPGTDTREGLFTVWARLDRDRMSGFVGAPNGYDLQSVPWVMYFDRDISLHGTYWHDDFGYRRSRGCVNLSISDARYLYEWFNGATPNEDGEIINYVYVWASGEYRSSGAATR